jgi:hypothetical protein
MSDRINSLTVVLEHDLTEEQAELLVNAISLLENVISVTPNITDPIYHVALMRERSRVNNKLLDMIKSGI